MRIFRLSFLSRMTIILIFSLVAIQVLVVMGYFIQRGSNTGTGFRWPLPDQVAAMVALIEKAGLEERTDILRAVNSAQIQVRIEDVMPAPPVENWRKSRVVERILHNYMRALEDHQVTVLFQWPASGFWWRLARFVAPATATVIVSLKDGKHLVIVAAGPLMVNVFGFPPGFWAGVIGFSVALLAIIIIRREIRPLRNLARAADSIDLGEPKPIADFPRSAPEIRAVIAAFNRMQQRIVSLIRERMVMIGGFSHDVRTYATRLRLRAELIEDEAERARAIRDIEDMISLLDNALIAIQDRPTPDNYELVDITALIHDEVEDKRAGGARAAMSFPGAETAPAVLGNLVALRRLFANLIDNAIAYGGEARLSGEIAGAKLRIHVEDRGPGIPPEQRLAVTQPFVRLERSRNRKTGGAGLGLAIAKKIAESHGGSLVIGEAAGGGARITVELPLFDPNGQENFAGESAAAE